MIIIMVIKNIVLSKDCDIESAPYLDELGVKIVESRRKIQFNSNNNVPVHRWAPYILGFSQAFVFSYLQRFLETFTGNLHLHDPFTGCGTTLVEANKSGEWTASGTELNPLLVYITRVKLESWNINPKSVWDTYEKMTFKSFVPYPIFLDTERQFDVEILKNLQRIRADILTIKNRRIKDLFNVAFASILIDSSRLKRTPSLGYDHKNHPPAKTPFILFEQRIKNICEDLRYLQTVYPQAGKKKVKVYEADARDFKPTKTHLVITSPPYMNGFDYVTNFKIEMAWLGFTSDLKMARELKDSMVACDNISKSVTKKFNASLDSYKEPWLDRILQRLRLNIENWGEEHKKIRIQRKRNGEALLGYRRSDMPDIVHKYFDDINQVMGKMSEALVNDGRAVFVIGDSFIADTYIPTDLLIAKMGTLHHLSIENIERARVRYSGQIRDFKLRETIVTLRKGKSTSHKRKADIS